MTAEDTKARKILLVDDHPLMLSGLEKFITTIPGLQVCGTATNAKDALTMAGKLKPELVITDLTLPGRNGLEFIKDLAATHPDISVIVFSVHDEMAYAERVLRAGGRGYVMKDSPPSHLREAIRMVLGGGVYASQQVTTNLLRTISTGKPHAGKGFPLECLTDREMEVFELIGQAKSNQEIATMLGISPRTLDAHRAHIREKLGFSEGNELTRHAIRWIEVGSIGS